MGKTFAIMVAAICAVTVVVGAQRQKDPTIPELLEAAGKYVTEYEKQFSGVVSEERYQQTADALAARGPRNRILQSDMLMFNGGALGWIGFRDVYEVDGLPVRDHTDRLLKILTNPAPDALEQARRVTDESARHNLGNITRTINIPTMALVFVRAENQKRSTFTFEGMKTVDKLRVAEVEFKETSKPRIIMTLDEAPASGKLWIEPATGRIVQTEFQMKSGTYTCKISVDYAHQPAIGLWVPVRMNEEYRGSPGTTMFISGNAMLSRSGSSGGLITGRADYRNFRKFTVDVSTIIK